MNTAKALKAQSIEAQQALARLEAKLEAEVAMAATKLETGVAMAAKGSASVAEKHKSKSDENRKSNSATRPVEFSAVMGALPDLSALTTSAMAEISATVDKNLSTVACSAQLPASVGAQESVAASSELPLPWFEAWSKQSSRSFYRNPITEESVWTLAEVCLGCVRLSAALARGDRSRFMLLVCVHIQVCVKYVSADFGAFDIIKLCGGGRCGRCMKRLRPRPRPQPRPWKKSQIVQDNFRNLTPPGTQRKLNGPRWGFPKMRRQDNGQRCVLLLCIQV